MGNNNYIVYRPVGNIKTNYDSDSGPGQQFHSQSSPGDLTAVEGLRNINTFSQTSKLGHPRVRATKGRLYESRVRDHVNVSSSTHIIIIVAFCG